MPEVLDRFTADGTAGLLTAGQPRDRMSSSGAAARESDSDPPR